MSLKTKLDERRTQFQSSAPEDAIRIMHRATEDLRNSGIMDRVLKEGDLAPQFSLPDQNGKDVSSDALIKKGPLVISIYRGVW